jgi:hypothetical protein
VAICWVEQCFEISEIETFKVFKLLKYLYFIPQDGFLKINYSKETIKSNFFTIPSFLKMAKYQVKTRL